MKAYCWAAVDSAATVCCGSVIGAEGTGRLAAATAFASRKELGASPIGADPGCRRGSRWAR